MRMSTSSVVLCDVGWGGVVLDDEEGALSSFI